MTFWALILAAFKMGCALAAFLLPIVFIVWLFNRYEKPKAEALSAPQKDGGGEI